MRDASDMEVIHTSYIEKKCHVIFPDYETLEIQENSVDIYQNLYIFKKDTKLTHLIKDESLIR